MNIYSYFMKSNSEGWDSSCGPQLVAPLSSQVWKKFITDFSRNTHHFHWSAPAILIVLDIPGRGEGR